MGHDGACLESQHGALRQEDCCGSEFDLEGGRDEEYQEDPGPSRLETRVEHV